MPSMPNPDQATYRQIGNERYYNSHAAAIKLGISLFTLYKEIKMLNIKAAMRNRKWWISESSMKKYMEGK